MAHMVKLANGQILYILPVTAPVATDFHASVIAQDQKIGVVRMNVKSMIVNVDIVRINKTLKSFASIFTAGNISNILLECLASRMGRPAVSISCLV